MTKYKIIIPDDLTPYPSQLELSAAALLAKYFQSDVSFIKRSPTAKTADFKIGRMIWEIKSPRGGGKYTIANNLRKASQQSDYIVIDLRRSNFKYLSVPLHRIRHELAHNKTIKKLLVITKADKVLDVK